MITPSTLKQLISLDNKGLTQIFRDSGYKDTEVKKATFLGITNGGHFCYKGEVGGAVGEFVAAKFFVIYNHATGDVTGEF